MMRTAVAPEQLAAELLARIGLDCTFTIAPFAGGRNNRVYRVETAHDVFILKQYFQNPKDLRDRLGNEHALLGYLRATGSRYAPRLLSVDRENRAILMEFIAGRRIALEDVTIRHIDHAIRFHEELNAGRFSELGRNLPFASEACFSLRQHLSVTQRRVDRLAEIDRDAAGLAADEIISLWKDVRTLIESSAEELPQEERCISASDFGFHNALETGDGDIRFFDFEYAGWDDPAKLIADFANQPDMTLDRSLSNRFAEAVIARHPYPEKLRLRAQMLEPLYQIKWACICLNDFLPGGQSRRDFTGHGSNLQLNRACAMLERAKETLLSFEVFSGTT
jgi:Ser/Thr protein kinase RdoA (MazF antagonist)